MKKFMFVYVGGDYPADQEAQQKHLQEYHQWLQNLGSAVVSPAIPFKDTFTVHPDGSSEPGSTTAISGMSILQFDSMDEAREVAKSCPFLKINGTLEVSEMLEMSDTVH